MRTAIRPSIEVGRRVTASFPGAARASCRSECPGDTFGLSTIDNSDVMTSWGSAALANGKKSDIFAAKVTQAP
jgi:hypothetical protein